MTLKQNIVTLAAVGALFGVAAERLTRAWLDAAVAAPEQRETGPFRAYERLEGGFQEMRQPVEPIVPRDHAVLYCFRQQQKLFVGNMRVDRDADGSVFVMMNRAMPDPSQSFDRQTLPPSDYRILPLQRDTRLKIGGQMLEACQNMWGGVPTAAKVTGLVQTLGL